MISVGTILRKEDSSLTHGGREDCVTYVETIADVVEKLEKDHDPALGRFPKDSMCYYRDTCQ